MNENRGVWRGKRLDNGEWIIGDLSRTQAADHFFITNYRHYFGFGVDTTTLGECTGLPDFNGTLAFESDLVKIKGLDVTGVIRYGDYKQPFNDTEDTKHIGFYVDWLDEHSKAFFRVDLGYWLPRVEIIGNIHDNPELMNATGEDIGNAAQDTLLPAT